MLAYWLGRSGRSVRLLERGQPGQEASGAYAGLLTTIAEGSGDGPYLRLSQQGLLSLQETIGTLEEETGIDIGLVHGELVRVAASKEEGAKLHSYWQQQREQGSSSEWWLQETLRAREAAFSPRVEGAIYSAREYHVVPARLLQATLTAAQRYGVKLETEIAVTRLLTDGKRVIGVEETTGRKYLAGQVVLASGAWTGILVKQLGVQLQLVPQRGQMLILAPHDFSLSFIVNTAWGYIVPKPDGTVVVGATQENVGFVKEVTAAGIAHLLRILTVLPPLMQCAIVQTFVGLRPVSVDGMPLLGPVPGWDGLFLATGHSQHGILLSDITARMLAAHLNGEDAGELWPAFQAKRAVSPLEAKEG
jgi:glycine oxidase